MYVHEFTHEHSWTNTYFGLKWEAFNTCNVIFFLTCYSQNGIPVKDHDRFQWLLHWVVQLSPTKIINVFLVGGWATPLKNISQLGWLFPIYGKIKNVPNHQPVSHPPISLSFRKTCQIESMARGIPEKLRPFQPLHHVSTWFPSIFVPTQQILDMYMKIKSIKLSDLIMSST